MPFAPHYRLTCTGRIGGTDLAPVEFFSFGVALDKTTPDSIQPDNDQFADLVADTTAFFARPATGIRTNAVLKQVKLARIGPDGKYLAPPMIAQTNVTGGSAITTNPPQVALAVSLVTDRYGPSGKGRFYLPSPAFAVDPSELTIGAADAAGVRGSVVTWLDALNNEPNIDVVQFGVAVASTKGYNSRVTAVRVGRALDTVRSRRRSLVEGYGPAQALASNND